MTNGDIAELLRKVAAAYQILEENRFKIIAYERAADSIEHLSSDAKDLWDEGKLNQVPGVGEAIAQHLDELFRTGGVRHFDDVMKKLPGAIYPLLSVPGLGPKKAYKLVKTLKLTNPKTVISDLEKAAKQHKIAPIEGFGEKSEEVILSGIASFKKGQIKENRMTLPVADGIAQDLIQYLTRLPSVVRVDPLGSLRRQVATIGDIDISVATKKPDEVIEHFVKYPHQKLIEKGPTGASLLLHNGRQVDMRVQRPESYGAMLQYFTGSKHHNIKLRAYALESGMSLSEYGIKDIRTKKLRTFATEEAFYRALGLPWIPPELREDKGEMEAALKSRSTFEGKPAGLPKLVELIDIKGDLHMHTSYDLEPSHDLGVDTLADHLDKAQALGYEYIGICDHNPSITNQTQSRIVQIMKRRKEIYEQQYSSWIKKVFRKRKPARQKVHLFIMCEVDILTDGKLALPPEAFDFVDAVIVSIHSSFTQEKQKMTERILRALTAHPKVRIFGHPTGRLLGARESLEADWTKIFSECKQRRIALEINAYPERLDLPESLVFEAQTLGMFFCINTDAHAASQMDVMRYGVSVARRGWVTKRDIVNCLPYNEFCTWLVR